MYLVRGQGLMFVDSSHRSGPIETRCRRRASGDGVRVTEVRSSPAAQDEGAGGPRPPSPRRFGALRSAGAEFLSSTAGSVVKLAGGTAAAQLLVVALAPVISRLYDPQDFGLLGVFVALVTILNFVGTLGY